MWPCRPLRSFASSITHHASRRPWKLGVAIVTGPVNFYADPSGLAALKKSAGEQDPKALRATARQFESLFTQMMMKSMRDASKSFGSEQSLMDNDQTDFYKEMFDNQLAMQLSKGKGIGLADMLVKQL